MATVQIRQPDLQGGRLPPLCVVCGEAADQNRAVRFSWHPGWVSWLWLVGLLPPILATLMTRRSMAAALPVCGRHWGHWSSRQRIIWAGLAVAFGLGCLGACVDTCWDKEVGEGMILSAVGMLLLVGLAIVVLYDSGVRPEEITDRTITLKGVSDRFVRAMGGHRGEGVPGQGIGLQTAKYLRGGY
jgi:hypothetical protein